MIVGNDQDGDDSVITAHVCSPYPTLFVFFFDYDWFYVLKMKLLHMRRGTKNARYQRTC